MTVETYLADYLAIRSIELKRRTVESYRDLCTRYILPAIGQIPLNDLVAPDVTHLLAPIVAAGHTRTAELCFVFLKAAFKELDTDPMRKVRRPKHVQQSPEPWNDDQIAAYLEALVDHPHRLPLTLCLVLGLRRGEACGLRWQDFDFSAPCVHIVNQRQRMADGEIIDGSPKSESSIRVLPLPAPLLPLLRSSRQISGYICRITPSGLDAAHRRLVKRLGLPPIPLHGLRHSMATACIRHGGNMRCLQALLGHANYATTANRYTHPDLQMLLATLELSSPMCYSVLR